jgi:hypothetical protein
MAPVTLYGEENIKPEVLVESPQNFTAAHLLRQRSPFPSPVPNCKPDDVTGKLFGPSPQDQRSAPRVHLKVHLWLTSLHRPGVFEIVLTVNVSNLGIQMVAQDSWEPAEQVLVSSPPRFLVRGSIVYCQKRPSDDHLLGIRCDAPAENWIETLGLENA